MEINRRILPTPEMIRSARGYLNWSQHELGIRCNLSKVSLVGIESGKQKPNHETLKRIAGVFWNEGLVFLENGGFRVEKNLIQVLDGEDYYKGLFEKIKSFFEDNPEVEKEVLINGADERKSPEEVNNLKKYLTSNGVGIKYLVSDEKAVVTGNRNDYKVIDEHLFTLTDSVVVTFGDNVAFSVKDEKDDRSRIILISSAYLAQGYKRMFNYLWSKFGK